MNNNTDQENQWRGEFESLNKRNYFTDNMTGKYLSSDAQKEWNIYLAARRQAHSEVEIFKSNCLIHEEDLNDEIQKLREQLREKGDKIAHLRLRRSECGQYVEQLEQELQKAYECVEFYASLDSWRDVDMLGTPPQLMNHSDEEFVSTIEESGWRYDRNLGGKLARETIKNRKVL